MNTPPPIRALVTATVVCAASVIWSPAAAAQDTPRPKAPVEFTLYPILVVAPIFGASIDLPSLPSRPSGDDGSGESGSSRDRHVR